MLDFKSKFLTKSQWFLTIWKNSTQTNWDKIFEIVPIFLQFLDEIFLPLFNILRCFFCFQATWSCSRVLWTRATCTASRHITSCSAPTSADPATRRSTLSSTIRERICCLKRKSSKEKSDTHKWARGSCPGRGSGKKKNLSEIVTLIHVHRGKS